MRDLKELQIDVRVRDPQPDFSEELLQNLETLYNVRLPQSYVEFLKFSNGGCPEDSCFTFPDGGSSIVGWFFHLDSQDWGPTGKHSIAASTEALRKLLYEEGHSFYRETDTGELCIAMTEYAANDPSLKPAFFDVEAIAIGTDGGPNLLFIDAAQPEGKVYIYYYDGASIHEVNDTFEGFIDSLHEYDEAA